MTPSQHRWNNKTVMWANIRCLGWASLWASCCSGTLWLVSRRNSDLLSHRLHLLFWISFEWNFWSANIDTGDLTPSILSPLSLLTSSVLFIRLWPRSFLYSGCLLFFPSFSIFHSFIASLLLPLPLSYNLFLFSLSLHHKHAFPYESSGQQTLT